MDCKIIEIKNSNLCAIISTLGAELLSLKKDSRETIFQGDEHWKGRTPILFPVCGALIDESVYFEGTGYKIPKHGFIRFKEFSVVETEEDRVTLRCDFDEDTLKQYPFKFSFEVTYTLDENTLAIHYHVFNKDNKSIYFTLGSHEGYKLDDDFENYSIEFEEEENFHALDLVGPLITDSYLDLSHFKKEIPLSYDFFKVDALVFGNINSRKFTLKHNGKEEIVVRAPDAKHCLLWSKPGAPFICIEPWEALPDKVDSLKDFTKKDDIICLKEGEEYIFYHTIEVK